MHLRSVDRRAAAKQSGFRNVSCCDLFSSKSRENNMVQNNNDRHRSRQNSAVGWMVGAIFVIAVVAAVFFYNGRDVGHQATTTDPTNAPSVTTGSSSSNN